MMAATGGVLDKYANNSQGTSDNGSAKRNSAREARWSTRALLWKISSIERVRKCGRVPVISGGLVGVRKSGEKVGYAGLATCGSVWADPVCNAKIQAVRRIEIGVAVSAGAVRGSMAFGAFTLRHHRGMALETLWRALSYCWNAMMRRSSVRRQLAEMGYTGYIRATEVTHGVVNGWHPHVHPLLFFDREVTDLEVVKLYGLMFDGWARAAERMNLEAPTTTASQLRRVDDPSTVLSDYLAKSVFDPESVGLEMTNTQGKHGRKDGHRTPWNILEDLERDGLASDAALWGEYEHVSKGKRALLWSQGMKSRLGIADREDEDIADEEVGDADDTGFWITDWGVIRQTPVLGAQLLAAVSAGGFPAGRRFCIQHTIPFKEAS